MRISTVMQPVANRVEVIGTGPRPVSRGEGPYLFCSGSVREHMPSTILPSRERNARSVFVKYIVFLDLNLDRMRFLFMGTTTLSNYRRIATVTYSRTTRSVLRPARPIHVIHQWPDFRRLGKCCSTTQSQ